MRHEDIAELWHNLRNASDISYILRECVGELSTFLIHGEQALATNHVRSIVLCKAIFDTQRIHLYTQDRDQRKDLSLKSLCDAVGCLSVIRHNLHQTYNRTISMESQSLIRQAFLSGLRSLLLRQQDFNQQTRDCLAEWSRSWHVWAEVDEKIIRPLLDDANQPSPSAPDLTLAKADSRGSAMFFLHNWKELERRLTTCNYEATVPFSQAFWLWYDARLALFNASYEFLQDNQNEAFLGSSKNSFPQRGMLAEVKNCVESFDAILRRLSASGTRSSIAQYLDDLEPKPHCHQCRANCLCFPPSDKHGIGNCDQMSVLLILKQLNQNLYQRNLAVFNGSHDLARLSKLLEKRKNEWMVKETQSELEARYEMHGSPTMDIPQSSLKASFVLNCDGMHCISGETLLHWIRQKKIQFNSEKLYQGLPIFDVYIDCGSCVKEGRKKTIASQARRIVPLSQMTDDIADLQARWEDFQPEEDAVVTKWQDYHSINSSTTVALPPKLELDDRSSSDRKSSVTGSLTGSVNTFDVTSSSNRSSTFSKWLKRDSLKSTQRLIDIEFQSTVAPGGQYVYVWHKFKLATYARQSQTWLPTPTVDGDIQLLCASSNILCLAVYAAEGSKLFIYRMPNYEQLGETIHINDTVHCMSLSLNCTSLLVGTSRQAIRILITRGTSSPVLIDQRRSITAPSASPADSTVESQAVAFSPNASRAILATRFKPSGHIKCMVFDTARMDDLTAKSLTVRRPLKLTVVRDFGLTSVSCFHDEVTKTTTCLVSSSVENGSQTLFAYDESREKFGQVDIVSNSKDGDLGASIHRTFAVPNTESFLLLNELGHFWTLGKAGAGTEKWTSTRHQTASKLLPKFSQNRRPRMDLTATSLREVYVSCIERDRHRLVVYDAGRGVACEVEETPLVPFQTST